ncbi:(2Fe-2S) ferredoxin domain-containing protein [Stutzerimonas kirkiae]|uniref:(2Fe-2S) ferredoxin domain-containing protein n=2 Tax=Stutzerimonas kirkiae TaxID=2211392 RepID=UPI001A955ED6|nr:(2Fe-2S) ferredoxin domain-containing protein [Stutzerimonas kirkiae]
MGFQCLLFVGPDLRHGAAGEAFRRQLQALRGEAALDDLVDTAGGFDALWARVAAELREGDGRLLLVDLDPNADSAYLDWLRGELWRLAEPLGGQGRILLSGSLLGRRPLDAAAACSLADNPGEQLDCETLAEIPAKPNWSHIPPHRHQLFLCIGARCVRRGALPLWKQLRQRLAAAGRIETEDGVLITRTYCQYPCNLGPIATVHPDGAWYRIASEEDVRRLVDEHLVGGAPLDAALRPPERAC